MTREDEIAANAVRLSTLRSIKAKKQLRIRQIKEEAEAKIREINIQYAEDPERLKAKYAAEDYAKSEKAKKRAERAIVREKQHIERENKLRPFTLGEEIFSSIVQGIGACLFIAATVLLDVFAVSRAAADKQKIYLILFTSCRVDIFLVLSCAYATYTYKIFSLANIHVLILSGIVWAICLVGIIMYSIAGSRIELVNIIFYAVLGWAGLFICKQLYQVLSTGSFSLLIVAGIFYTIGLVFCSVRKIKFFYAVGNLIMLLASVYLFFSLFFII